MKSLFLVLVSCLGAVSCDERAPTAVQEEPTLTFSRRMSEEGGIAFECWNGKLQGVDSDYRLHFVEDSKVELQDFGYAGVERFNGAYVMEPGGRITIELENFRWKWPAMVLRRDGGDLLLFREDGVTGWPIYATEESNPNEIREGFWPFRASAK